MVLSQATSWCLWWRQKWSVSTTDLLASRPSTLKGCAPEASRSLGDWEAYLGYLEAAPHIPCRVVDSWLQCCIPYSYVVVANEYYRHKHEHDKWSYLKLQAVDNCHILKLPYRNLKTPSSGWESIQREGTSNNKMIIVVQWFPMTFSDFCLMFNGFQFVQSVYLGP